MNESEDFLCNIIYTSTLNKIESLNSRDIKKLLDYFKKAEFVFESSRNEIIKVLEPKRNVAAIAESILRSKKIYFDKIKEEILGAYKIGVSFILYNNDDYPYALKKIPDPPALLYVKGSLLPEDSISIAVVGTRKPSNYGRMMACRLSESLAKKSITVVSGLARGIDSESHKAALKAGGRTIAVMGTGMNITYPAENKKLRKQIEESGCIITEFPLDSQPHSWRFPARNRIISGMTLGTLVVEAPDKSGALITSRLALEYNREVFAVPGNVNSKNSKGCNSLIQDGAKMVTRVDDILEEFEMNFNWDKEEDKVSDLNLSDTERTILDAIGSDEVILEMVVQKTGLPSYTVSGALLQMEINNIVRRMPNNNYISLVEDL